jgi:hypothetical protein
MRKYTLCVGLKHLHRTFRFTPIVLFSFEVEPWWGEGIMHWASLLVLLSFVMSMYTGGSKPFGGDIGKRTAYSKEQCMEFWNCSSGATYWKKEF